MGSGADRQSLDQGAQDFDEPKFAAMAKSTGAGYVIWSITWWNYWMQTPNAAVDSIMGNGSITSNLPTVESDSRCSKTAQHCQIRTLNPKSQGPKMINQDWAKKFAEEWIDSWNSHDMGRILSHYTDDFEMSSPLIVERLRLPEGKLKGKRAIGEYWRPSLSMDPPLKFELVDVFVGISELTIYYKSVGRRVVVETLSINDSGKATRGISQWSISNQP